MNLAKKPSNTALIVGLAKNLAINLDLYCDVNNLARSDQELSWIAYAAQHLSDIGQHVPDVIQHILARFDVANPTHSTRPTS
jgi:hypothetical protein